LRKALTIAHQGGGARIGIDVGGQGRTNGSIGWTVSLRKCDLVKLPGKPERRSTLSEKSEDERLLRGPKKGAISSTTIVRGDIAAEKKECAIRFTNEAVQPKARSEWN